MPAVGSPEFVGALHLHGRVADRMLNLSQTDLVLTAPNFGEAYMRNGWASRTVYDLMRRYTLVLVGYSADDPPMRYMLEATEEGRLDRKSVVEGKSVSVRLDLGGRRIIKKKKKK